MAMQLTPEQEERIHAVVRSGAYSSPAEALAAAVEAVAGVSAPGFEGTPEEFDQLMTEGLSSGEPIEVDESFWSRVTAATDRMAADHHSRKPPQ